MQRQIQHLRKKIFKLSGNRAFEKTALEVFRLQAEYNPTYREYIRLLDISPLSVNNIHDIPFLPVSFFKTHTVNITSGPYETIFTSSGTTDSNPSKHPVPDLTIYRESFIRSFRFFYGDITNYCILALLPSYLERTGSSLVYMLDRLIRLSRRKTSGFYLHNHDQLYDTLQHLVKKQQKVLLFGVSFALLDFAEKYELTPTNLTVMETGGMKGRRQEMVREELHTLLKKKFHVSSIHSEYGMTELLSQAYSSGDGIFRTPPWMRVLIRDTYDPFSYTSPGHTGGINIIDLANIYSCSFIETQDLGRLLPHGNFTVEGRFDNSEMRGCNLMVQEI